MIVKVRLSENVSVEFDSTKHLNLKNHKVLEQKVLDKLSSEVFQTIIEESLEEKYKGKRHEISKMIQEEIETGVFV